MFKTLAFFVACITVGKCITLAHGKPYVKYEPDFQVNLRLFTRNNPDESQILIPGDSEGLLQSNFDVTKSLKVFAHGRNSPWNLAGVSAAFLNESDTNVIIIDWTAGSFSSNESYLVRNAEQAGRYAASFIDWINTFGLPNTNIHVVGFSIGSHVAGFTARLCQNGKIEYVTGLDPPISAFEIGGDHIKASDGKYVEIIHTSGGSQSIMVPIGTADFYPNKGFDQPGCNGNNLCEHMRAVALFIESVGSQSFGAIECSSYDAAVNASCFGPGRSFMGGTSPAKNISGVYYLETNGASPFAQGRYFKASQDVLLKLYTRENPTSPQVLISGNYSSIILSNFDFKKPLKIFCHGWAPQWDEPELVKAWLSNNDVNVILVDWTAATNTSDEALMVSRVPLVAQHVAGFIDWVSVYGIDFREVHVAGMSVGSHVAGHIARFCSRGVVEYVTGCDPPKRFWQDQGGWINEKDGRYVEIIHTSTLVHSFENPIGTADFYPNGGGTMPGCNGNDLCDHLRALRYFTESIGNTDFQASKCTDYEEIQNGTCSNLAQSYLGGTGRIGAAKNASGVYYLKTNAQSPFAQGNNNDFNPDTDVYLRLYTRDNPTTPQLLVSGNYSTILLSNFDFKKPLKFFCHGWAPQWDEPELVKAWLNKTDANVIQVDWTAATNTQNESLMVSRVPLVAEHVAGFIDWVSDYGIQFSEIHVVGMSVGSHLAGHIGRFCKKGVVEYVTGCDPPKRFWQDQGGWINPADGKYVEVIHTSTLVHSFEQPIGTADFYPNGGGTMPGCNGNNLCDHMRALMYFIESVGTYDFVAKECANYEEIQNNSCSNLSTSYLGGTGPAKNITGVYYLTTNANSPYAQGEILRV